MAGFHDLLSYDTYAVGAVAASTAIALVLYDKRKTRRSYPPGPRGYPVVGNYFGWPKGKIWEGFTQMAKDHSEYNVDVVREPANACFVETDLLHLEVFGSHVLVLSKAGPIIELLDRRSALYSDRVSVEKHTPLRLLMAVSPRRKELWRLSCALSVSLSVMKLMKFLQYGCRLVPWVFAIRK